MWRLGGLLALLAATTNAQDVPRPTRLRIYEVRTALARGFEVRKVTKNTHRSKLRGRHAAEPVRGVAAAGVGARRRDRPRAARGDGRRLRPHRRRRDLLADDPAPGGRDPLPRARAGAAIALASSFRPLQPLGGSPVPACSCSSPSTTTIPPPRSKIIWSHK